jgi:hypothetical protein
MEVEKVGRCEIQREVADQGAKPKSRDLQILWPELPFSR